MPTDRPTAPGAGAVLRKARPSDASSLAALSLEVWLGTYLRRGVNGFFADYALAQFTAARFGEWIASPRETFLLSQNDDGIDGFIRISHDAPAPAGISSHVEIATLYIQPRHQGKGIGKALLATALDGVQHLGAASVWLAANSENAAALGFYRAQGFENVGQTHFPIGDRAFRNEILLCRLAR